jgi:Heparinase II/III-like protein/Heparinase II/III N-terminus
MDWEEIRFRVAQEFLKRADLALYRAGVRPLLPSVRDRRSAPTKFFFGADEGKNEPAHRAELLRVRLPREANAIIQEADEICRHEFRLLGYDKADYGQKIDWHAAQGKRAPMLPWFRINFLDFATVGDHKAIWELNRHQHLVTLAKARLITGNPAYTNELVAQWYSWQRANPYPLGINWASALEVAFRSLSWVWVRNLLAGCPELPETFRADLLPALQLHGRYIERYLSTYFSPNTHLLGEAVALFFIGTLCPEISAAERWRKNGWELLLKEAERQVRSDGVYFEQSLYYHVYALDFFLHARHLASENGFVIPQSFDAVLKKMLDVLRALSGAGTPHGFGDDDGGRVFNPRRNRVECMTDPLALGAVLYDCDKYATAGLTEEAIWLFGDRAIETFETPQPQRVTESRAFEEGGIYLLNDDQPRVQQIMIDAGPQGSGNSGHGHADALSVRYSLDGHHFLIDPGTYCYVSPGPERDWFRGTAAHNTLRVDNLDQAIPGGPFAWKETANVKDKSWVKGQTYDYFVGSHDGYLRLADPVLHRRFVFHVKGGLWFVRDVAEGRGTHLLETFWHFAADVDVNQVQGGILAAASATAERRQSVTMALLVDRNSAWKTEITEGFVSPAYGCKQVARVVRVGANTKLPAECGVLLLPTAQASDAGVLSSLGGSEGSVNETSGYRYQSFQVTEFLFFSDNHLPWKCGPWASDARFLYCKLESGRFTQVIMIDGSFAEWSGRRFVSLRARANSFEWLNRDGLKKVLSPGNDSVHDSVINDFEVVEPTR